MLTQAVTVNAKEAQNIIIGRRGAYETEQVVFDLTYLIETYGSGSAILMVKRPNDQTAYPATTTQDGTELVWTVTETDTSYKGHGECELFWYTSTGLAKSVIYSIAILRDIGTTSEEQPDPYQTWVDTLTDLGAETLANAQTAVDAKDEAVSAANESVAAKDASVEAKNAAVEAKEAAEAALEEFTTPTATAQTLEPGSAATASYANGNFTFGIPQGAQGERGERGEQGIPGERGEQGEQGERGIQGEKGDTGATPDLSIGTVSTLPAGSDATATITGTAEEPVLNLGIPKGDKGDAGEVTQAEFDVLSDTVTQLNNHLSDLEDILPTEETGQGLLEEEFRETELLGVILEIFGDLPSDEILNDIADELVTENEWLEVLEHEVAAFVEGVA